MVQGKEGDGQGSRPGQGERITILYPQYPWKDWVVAYNEYLKDKAAAWQFIIQIILTYSVTGDILNSP